MDEVLQDLGLSSCIPLFQEQKVGPKEVLELSNIDLEALGVINIGDKACLKKKCRTFQQLPDSPTILKLRELSSRRDFTTRKKQTRQKISNTRRVHCGWMSKKKTNGVFCRVSGGKTVIEMEKKATLQEVQEKFLDLYFPDGENKIQGIMLDDVHFYIGNYAGAPLRKTTKNGQEFSLENYYEEIRTYPIRLYIFTSPKDEDLCINQKTPDESEEEPLPKLHLRKRSRTSVQKPTAQSRSDGWTIESAVCDKEMDEELQSCSSELHVPSDSGTPTVIFKRASKKLGSSDYQKENMTAVDILKELQKNIQTNGKKNIINVDRNNILDCKNSFRREKFKEDQPLFIRFSGERGIDDGGPSREFMRLMIKSVAESSIFEGEDRKKMLLQNLLAEKDGDYETYGKIIAYCLVNGGPAPTFMSEFLYGLLAYGPESADPTIEDIVDDEYKEQVQKIEMSTDIASFFDAVDPMKPLLDYIGGLPLAVNPQKKNELVHALCRHIVIYQWFKLSGST